MGLPFLQNYELERNLKSHPRVFYTALFKLQNRLMATGEAPSIAVANFARFLAPEMVPSRMSNLAVGLWSGLNDLRDGLGEAFFLAFVWVLFDLWFLHARDVFVEVAVSELVWEL